MSSVGQPFPHHLPMDSLTQNWRCMRVSWIVETYPLEPGSSGDLCESPADGIRQKWRAIWL